MPLVSMDYECIARRCLAAVCAALLAMSAVGDAAAQAADADALLDALQEQAARLSEQENKLAKQEKEMEAERRTFEQEKLEFEKLRTQAISITGRPVPGIASPAQKQATSANNTVPGEVGVDKKEAKDKPPEVAAIIEEGGVLAGKGKLVITPALEYDRSSATSVEINGLSIIPAVNIGSFDVSKVDRDLISPSIDFRYGLTNRFEIEAKVPYVWRRDATLERPLAAPSEADTLSTVNGHDIGDIEFGAHYQLNSGHNNWPYFIGNLRFKTATGTSPFDVPIVGGRETRLPTGSGFYAVQPSVTAIYPSDPLVYYGNIGYLRQFSRSFANYGNIDPGDAISASMGMSLSLNDKSSFSAGYSHTMVMRTLENGAPLADSTTLQIGTLDFGYSYNWSDSVTLNFMVSAGVTRDAPDVRLIFSMPMTFDLL
ncbi:MAG: transporter [Pseudomonadota bacterium]|nr:transporter [Pseudomonadota bacterium]